MLDHHDHHGHSMADDLPRLQALIERRRALKWFAGAGTAVNGSVTFAGLSLADAQGKITLTPGSVGGRSYLYAHYDG